MSRVGGAPPFRPPGKARGKGTNPDGRLDAGAYPVLAAAIDGLWGSEDARFEFGLRAVVAGLRDRVREAARSPADL